MDWSEGESCDGLGSDVEQIPRRKSKRKHLSNDYSLGLKVMECCLVKKAFDNFKSDQNDFDVNVAFANEVLHFPYQDVLQRAIHMLGDEYDLESLAYTSNSVSLATLLGATYRINQKDHVELLRLVESPIQIGTQNSKQPESFEYTMPAQKDARQEKSFFEETQQLPQYAMRLNEYAQMHEFRISWDETKLSLDPPKFRAATRIQGQSFEGIASNKKTARHLAAKQACIKLKI